MAIGKKRMSGPKAHGRVRDLVLKPLLALAGILFLGLAVLGFLLPMFPGLLFLVLAAACFARSSERLHTWLLASPTFGPMIEDWQTHRAVSPRSKAIAIGMTIVLGGWSIHAMIEPAWMQWTALCFLTAGVAIIASLRTRPEPAVRR